jgi:hypothetical protein
LRSAGRPAARQPQDFATPEAAVDAFMAALKADSDAAMVAIFGDAHKDLLIPSDRAEASANRARLLAAMQTLRVLREPGPDRRVLVIGDQAWPMPIPIVRTGDRWRFATEEGADEVVNRRIGGNERNAIYALNAYIDAQRAYAARDRDGDGVLQYAQKLASTSGKQDGLYWPADAAKGEEPSPFGPLIAESAAYLKGHKASDPFRGYHFKILTRQGERVRKPTTHHQRPHDRRLCAGRLSGPVRRKRRDVVHGEQQRPDLREGPRQQFERSRTQDDELRPGPWLERVAGIAN